MKLEAKIGLFVVLALSALFILSTQVTSISKFNNKYYYVHLHVKDATGLNQGSKVLMNGVGIGEISTLALDKKGVDITLAISLGVEIAKDSTAEVVQESVLGAKQINLKAGVESALLKDGEEVEQTKVYATFDKTSDSMNDAARELQLLMKDLREVLNNEHKEKLREMITSFNNVGHSLDGMLVENRDALRISLNNMKEFTSDFKVTAQVINETLPSIMGRLNNVAVRLDDITANLEHKLPVAVDKFIKIEDNVTTLIDENREALNNTLTSADSFFDSGHEAFDKVDSMLSNFTVSELQVGLNTQYLVRDGYAKSRATFAYLPNPETYYMADIINTSDFTLSAPEDPAHEKGKIYISAQYGKRYGNALLRAGIIESSGGAGVDYFMFNDTLALSFDAFDFGAVNDIRGNNAHLVFQVRYRMLKHLEFFGGWDNFANPDAQNIYFGLGMKFIDNNLKYLLGSAASAAGK